jgi:hypothetical protein
MPKAVALFEALQPSFCGLLDYLRFHAVQSRVGFHAVKMRVRCTVCISRIRTLPVNGCDFESRASADSASLPNRHSIPRLAK